MENTLSPRYSAPEIESKWYAAWESAGLFQPEDVPQKTPYTITIPPPNITGSLHLGHSLCYPIQDLLARYKRLRGFNVHVIPGQDHAGIATQSVVSKQLIAKGIQPSSLGREAFVEKVWEWRQESGDAILRGFKMLGCGFDWSCLRFTLDDQYVEAVLKVFIDWYRKGLIYRGKRIVNWDPVLLTSVSDIETERKTISGKLYVIRYPYADGSGDIQIATTRPETMLGDVAIAVHPSDKRYTEAVGKEVIVPLVGRQIPVIADIYPDPEFGSGAVKVTPAHDPNDFEIGERHSLEPIIVLDPKANVCFEGDYFGLNRYVARKKIVADLEESGHLVRIEDHQIPIIVSDRSKEVIEPLLSEQWFVKQTELAAAAAEAVSGGKITLTPDGKTKVLLDWLENIRDWCISRQLWWGHRIPIYYTEDGTPYAAMNWEDAQKQAGENKIVRQEEDVLDTWFSSGLWPFAVLGWPQQDPNRDNRYPTDVLVTDVGIIYLWVARMAMMSLDNVGEIPFKQVYIHATVLNEKKERMSKSLGTGVDPEPLIAAYGADSLRYTLLSQAGMNQAIIYSEKRVEEARNLCNKIWNAARFILMNASDVVPQKPKDLQAEDRWILHQLAEVELKTRQAYDDFDIMAAAHALTTWFWSDYCDWMLEVAKPRLNDPERKEACLWVLLECFEAFLKMLHPIMPFITEEVTMHLPLIDKQRFVMASEWPHHVEQYLDESAAKRVARWFEIVRGVRALRADLEIDPRKAVSDLYFEGDLDGGEAIVASQAWVENIHKGRPSGQHVSGFAQGIEFHLLTEAIDKNKLLEKNQRELSKATLELEKANERLGDPQFIDRAKPEVIERMRQSVSELSEKIEKAKQRIAVLAGK